MDPVWVGPPDVSMHSSVTGSSSERLVVGSHNTKRESLVSGALNETNHYHKNFLSICSNLGWRPIIYGALDHIILSRIS